jgi:outer membrane protein assembly factor BamB
MKNIRRLSILVTLSLLSIAITGSDWPEWRGGPYRTDISTEKNLLSEWPEGGPKQLWTFTRAGSGYSGFSIVEGKLFTMGTRDGKEVLLALDAEKGGELWSTPIADVLNNGWGDGPRGTPTVNDGLVYALSGKGNLLCAKAADGAKVWEKSMESLGGKIPGWGYTESPLIDGDKVICTPGGDKGAIAALNKKTGELVWQSKEFTDGAQYSSLTLAEPDGVQQYIQLTMQHVVGVSAKDGSVVWISPWPGRTAVIPTPIYDNGMVYVTSGYGVGCTLLKLGKDKTPTEVYGPEQKKVMKNHHGGVVKVGDHLYGHSDGGGWVCQEFKTGKMVWNEKDKLGKGALSVADGKLYCLDEQDGTVALVDASPAGWKEHGRFKLSPLSKIRSPQGHIWTHPVISNGRLYLRDQDIIFCYDIKKS